MKNMNMNVTIIASAKMATKTLQWKDLRIISEVGKGSHGTVYKCCLKSNPQEIIAVKKIQKRHQGNIHETNHDLLLAKDVQHPNIVHYLGTDIDEQYAYVFTKLIHGVTSDQMIKNALHGSPWREKVVKALVLDVCNALEYLHDNSIVYNDFKPNNIMIDTSGKYSGVLIDLGSAVKMQNGLQADCGRPIGTPYFFAPEKWEWQYGFSSDVWSLGVLIYMYLCGQHPFIHRKVADPRDLQLELYSNPLEFKQPIWKDRSSECKHLIQSILQYHASDRPSVSEIKSHPWMLQ